uniref:Uncharacterized protein n=3 Tax=unclassified Prevotella TaxID=2638335 RepID=A0AB33JMM3_9BACT
MAIALTAMAIFSCGTKHRAKGLVEDYLASNLVNQDIADLSVSDVDSSFYITPTVIKRMETHLAANKRFKKDIKFKTSPNRKVLFVRAKYVNGQDTLKQTFYFDDHLTTVIACKDN